MREQPAPNVWDLIRAVVVSDAPRGRPALPARSAPRLSESSERAVAELDNHLAAGQIEGREEAGGGLGPKGTHDHLSQNYISIGVNVTRGKPVVATL